MSRKLLVVLSAAIGTLVLVPSADAFTTLPLWGCRASPSYTAVNDGNRVEPFAANGNINTAKGANPDHAQLPVRIRALPLPDESGSRLLR